MRIHLARPIDPRYRSNVQIIGIAFLAGAIFTVRFLGEAGFGGAILDGLLAGGAVFLAWAIGREIDPDEPNAALVGAMAAIPIVWLLGTPSLLIVATVLMAGRVLLRPSGHPPSVIDLLGLTGLGIFAARSEVGWVVALVLAFAIARDGGLGGGAARGARWAAAVIAAGATGVAIRSAEPGWVAPDTTGWVVLGLGIVSAILAVPYHPESTADLTGERLSGRRKQAARRTLSVAGVLSLAVGGAEGVVALSPVWAAFIGVLLVGRVLSVRTGPEAPPA